MMSHVGFAQSRGRFVVVLSFLSFGACADSSIEPTALEQNLVTAGSAATCMAVDSADTVPDGIDEDCDGKVDENVDATRARCPKGMRVIEGTRGNDTLRGTSGRDCILGYGGNDTIYGESGDDVIFGGPGDDRIFTGRGNAIVHGGAGNDVIDTSGSLFSTVYGEAGNDTLIGGKGIDSMFGGEDNDKITGGGGLDLLSGGGCHDYIKGSKSFDLANGGADVDACEAEVTAECEKNARTRKLCESDTDCSASERCAVFTKFCVPRSAKACGAGGTPPTCTPTAQEDETCNGIDDDCNGRVDEDYLAEPKQCGAGSCHSMGETACVNGTVVDTCSAGSPMGMDAVCNGVDDDCDGRTDEGFVSTSTSCGIGACAASGSLSCVNGTVVDSCQAGMPGAATDTTCDGVDDDCDGNVDEEYAPESASCGVGACVSSGVTSCVGGEVQSSCIPGTPPSAADASCDGVDNNCNGQVDEDYVPMPTNCGFGECATTGVNACQNGHIVDTCHVTCEGNCADGGEDDGDGLVDCADPDCQNKPSTWPQCAQGYVGSSCSSSSDCVAGNICETNFPGGYCYQNCGGMGACPAGSFCWAGAVCVQPCVGPMNNQCPRPEHVCQPLTGSGVTTPFCRPNCLQSCPTGTTCRPDTLQCM
jgi:hypothetical protein